MNCNWIKDNVVLYIYEELADDAKYEFEHHMRHCLVCKQEVESALAFKSGMSAQPIQEVSPNLLTASRMRLQEVLEETKQSQGWNRLVFDLAGWMQQIKLAPSLAVALLMVGFAGGALTSYRLGIARQIHETAPQTPALEASIAGIDSIVPDDTGKRVVIKYNTLAPQTLEGTTDEPRIQELLLMGTRNLRNPDVRLRSVDILNRQSAAIEIREALINSLRTDKNPGVRLKVLEGLKGYVHGDGDVHVRDAVVEALIRDTNAGVRSEALSLLNPVRADTSVREALKLLAQHDKDDYIRSECRRVLASTPNLD
jgi:hypothetical protein